MDSAGSGLKLLYRAMSTATFAPAPPEKFTIVQPDSTYSGAPIRPLPK